MNSAKLDRLNYEKYPVRKSAESAVVEWGYSAVISALDAVVAQFGAQPSRGAFFEVEAAPILADPIDGHTGIDMDKIDPPGGKYYMLPNWKLRNEDEVHGNMVVMTNAAGLSPVSMAKIAIDSGAVALMIVNTLDTKNPDFVYSADCFEVECDFAEESIDIPVIMVSLTSGNVLTTANAPPPSVEDEVAPYGLPDRVRLYSGGDRPFFEDVSNDRPMVYIIHNLMTDEECDALIKSAENKVKPYDESVFNYLEGTDKRKKEGEKQAVKGVERAYLWRGVLKSFEQKQIDERIEQVTGFPQDHFSDFQVNKFQNGAYDGPHHDSLPGQSQIQSATIHVFLSDLEDTEEGGGELVFPSANPPIKIRPKKGMAVVYHNHDEEGTLDTSTIHAELATTASQGVKWTARKWIYSDPLPPSRRTVLPLVALLFGGKLPSFVKAGHDILVYEYGVDQGSFYFDKACVICPILLLFGITSLIGKIMTKKNGDDSKQQSSTSKSKSTNTQSSKKTKKKNVKSD
eukprot:CAMPEP_0195507700 /NCGR_PEP_ID=MMETSP0794_2-20130614/1090_1 /TAXON_ID=515487 /ORGANISM="Stephanopyxis turris, Strain CCMP 815" /LENGTH=513 /DNA_ID=CAMNT_0040634463 /DNA_START=247 /DNA_END=1788 /DNA_ORIENTATION=-